MTIYADNAARFATRREQYLRQLENEALADFAHDLADARHWTHRALAATGEQRDVDLTWARLVSDAAHATVVQRLERLGAA